jgi:hypothetical protein
VQPSTGHINMHTSLCEQSAEHNIVVVNNNNNNNNKLDSELWYEMYQNQ